MRSHDLAIFQDVGHAGGHAQIVFENVIDAIAAADEVDSGDVATDGPGAEADRSLVRALSADQNRGTRAIRPRGKLLRTSHYSRPPGDNSSERI